MVVGFVFFFSFFCKKSYATIATANDTISTSRPSASTPLDEDLPSNYTKATVLDNLSRFIASDSAKLIGGTTNIVTVATMSAADNPSAGKRIVYFAGAYSSAHNKGTVLMTPITAKHIVSFATTAVPVDGKLQVFFPIGDTSNQASPSASGFSFNNLQSTNVGVSGASCSSISIDATTGKVECTLSSSLTLSSNSVIITVGSSTPALINPTKIAAMGTGDSWLVRIVTLDDTSVQLDQKKVKAATIDSVETYATVDPIFTFTIAGRTNGGNVNVGNTGCSSSDTINTGFDSTAAEVNLGVLSTLQKNLSSQLVTISTNAPGGYILTATSSGHFIDASIGYWIDDIQGTPTNIDTPVPAVLTAGTPGFGIHPCGVDVTGSGVSWGDGGGANAKYANPSPVYYYTLAKNIVGPITNVGDTGKTTIVYGASVSYAVPAGFYRTVLTYVATPSF